MYEMKFYIFTVSKKALGKLCTESDKLKQFLKYCHYM